MEVDTSVIDDILRGARYQSEIHDRASFRTFLDRLVLPGMVLHLDPDRPDVHHSWALGPGLRLLPKTTRPKQLKSWDSIVILQFGVLRQSSTAFDPAEEKTTASRRPTGGAKHETHHFCLWLERPHLSGVSRSLAPLTRTTFRCTNSQFHVGDRVVGLVTRRVGDNYMVDIGCGSPATLNYLAFEGASKKNRPDLGPGDVLYAMVTQADRDLDIELSCVDEAGRASGMGILGRQEPGTVGNAGGMKGGVMLHCSPGLVRQLADQDNFPFLTLLSKVFPFEVCLGANGRIWLTARSSRETTLLANAIAIADHIPQSECCKLAQILQ
ncbi:exosome complex component RRP40 [Clonorchis sinensis]|uniref:Ribosomal RNA-processing protein 40 n=1 Tax=Clonorchis sinensis TaxID=79923 RepID=G7YS56_CLOSI|nr:exosome complex component RRP40 [Clonorchis sinensis]